GTLPVGLRLIPWAGILTWDESGCFIRGIRKRFMLRIAAVVAGFALLFGASFGRKASAQSDSTLAGEWILSFTPINGQFTSKFGNTLGFADRDITFNQDGSLLTAIVDREDLGPSVKPLGDWRVLGENFSATFELWCPDPSTVCGTVTLRGSF